MRLADLILLVENKLSALNRDMANAVQLGDVDEVGRLDPLIAETQATLNDLKTL